jgi:hypothetical protein
MNETTRIRSISCVPSQQNQRDEGYGYTCGSSSIGADLHPDIPPYGWTLIPETTKGGRWRSDVGEMEQKALDDLAEYLRHRNVLSGGVDYQHI